MSREFKRAPFLENNVILEIGPLDTPFPIFGEKGRKMGEGEYYVAADIDRNKAESALNVLNLFGFPKNRVIITAGATSRNALLAKSRGGPCEVGFPLCDGGVKEVIISNVLGDPDVRPEDAVRIINEAARVVNKEGEVIVVQTRPFFPLIEDLKELMEWRGFKIKNEDTMYDTKEIDQYRPSEGNKGEYILKFSRNQLR